MTLDARTAGRLDLELLAGFVAVVDHGSIKAAAEHLFITPSAVSMQIKRLEERVDKRLLDRDPRHLALTEDGKILVGYARRIVDLTEEARSQLSAPALSGPVRLGLPEWIAGRPGLARVLGRFQRVHPQVRLEVHADASWILRDLIARDELDLALTIMDPQAGSHRENVYREPLIWMVGEDAVLEVEEEELPLALFVHPCVFRDLAINGLQQCGWRGVEVFSSKSVCSIQAAVQSGLGLTVLPKSALRPGLRALGPDEGFPSLPDIRLEFHRAPGQSSKVAEMLRAEITHYLGGVRTTASPDTAAGKETTG